MQSLYRDCSALSQAHPDPRPDGKTPGKEVELLRKRFRPLQKVLALPVIYTRSGTRPEILFQSSRRNDIISIIMVM